MVLPHELKFAVGLTDGQTTLLSQQTYLLMPSVPIQWKPLARKGVMAVLPSCDGVPILGLRALREQVKTDVRGGMVSKALGLDVGKTNDQVFVRRAEMFGILSAWHVPVLLPVVQRIADEDKNPREALLARKPEMRVELNH